MAIRPLKLGLAAWAFSGLGLALLLAPASANACRCDPRVLTEYFASADEVFVGELVQAMADGDRWRLKFAAERAPFKAALPAGWTYATYLSSASCGLETETGATYVVFAEHDSANQTAWLTSCNGSRVFRPRDGQARDFGEIPARFVLSQLNAAKGLDILGQIASAEPRTGNPTNETLVGLLEIEPANEPWSLRAAPRADAEQIATVSLTELESRESGYEVDAAKVFAIAESWYRVRLANGTYGWMNAPPAAIYHPYDDLPVGRLAYFNEHWDGLLWPNLGAGIPTQGPRREPLADTKIEIPIRVLESRRLAGSLWFRVELLSADGCSAEGVRVLLAGWTPAYGADGEPAVWYYSRGC